jgi:hypothetical protein
VAGQGRGGSSHRRRGDGIRGRERAECEFVDPHRPLPAAPGGDRELDGGDPADLSPTEWSPGELDLPLLDGEGLPPSGEHDVAAYMPPDVLTARVDELELEVIARRFAPDPEGEGVVLREFQVDGAAGHGIAPALETEIAAERASPGSLVGAEGEIHPVRGMRRPGLDGFEIVHHDRPGGGSCARLAGERCPGAHPTREGYYPERRPTHCAPHGAFTPSSSRPGSPARRSAGRPGKRAERGGW